MSRRGREASDRLTRRLVELARKGIRPRCGDGEVSHNWTSEYEGVRQLAALWCADCPVEVECLEAAIANREVWSVYGGRDFSIRDGRKKVALSWLDRITKLRRSEPGPAPIWKLQAAVFTLITLDQAQEENMSLGRRARLIVGASIVAISCLTTPASAGPAPEAPAHPSLCDVYGVGRWNANLPAPEVYHTQGPGLKGPLHGEVRAAGSVEVSGNTSCSHAQVEFRLQTKACGRVWRCSWQTRDKTERTLLPENGTVPYNLKMECRKGTNSYRVQASVTHVEASFEQSDATGKWYPYLENKEDRAESPEIKETC